jgi:hypothetical protein
MRLYYGKDEKVQVFIPGSANIEASLKAIRGKGRIQQVLNQCADTHPTWDPRHDVFTGVASSFSVLRKEIVMVDPSKVQLVWAYHAYHKGSKVGLSPFVHTDKDTQGIISERFSKEVTICLRETASRLLCVSAHVGPRTYPLPWMDAASSVPGTKTTCEEYWRHHAFVFRKGIALVDGASVKAPSWYDS